MIRRIIEAIDNKHEDASEVAKKISVLDVLHMVKQTVFYTQQKLHKVQSNSTLEMTRKEIEKNVQANQPITDNRELEPQVKKPKLIGEKDEEENEKRRAISRKDAKNAFEILREYVFQEGTRKGF